MPGMVWPRSQLQPERCNCVVLTPSVASEPRLPSGLPATHTTRDTASTFAAAAYPTGATRAANDGLATGASRATHAAARRAADAAGHAA